MAFSQEPIQQLKQKNHKSSNILNWSKTGVHLLEDCWNGTKATQLPWLTLNPETRKCQSYMENAFKARSQRSCLFKKSKMTFWSFQKILEKNVYVANDVYFKRATSQFEIRSSIGYTKKTESENVWMCPVHTPDL
jgi:hypothetical protein